METPDKLFISSDPFGFMSAYYIENHPPHGEEYIRKDALMEWAKARKAELTSSESFVAGERKIIKEVIDKIESL